MDNKVSLTDLKTEVLEAIKNTLESQKSDILKEIKNIKENSYFSARKLDKLTEKVISLEKEIKNMTMEIEKIQIGKVTDSDLREENRLIDNSSVKYNSVVDNLENAKMQKESLEDLMKTKRSFVAKRFFKKKITKLDNKISKLRTKKEKIEIDQRKIFLGNQQKENKENKKKFDLEAKKEYLKVLSEELEEIKEEINPGIFSSAKQKVLDIQGKLYQKNIKKAEERLNKLQNGNNKLTSANHFSLPKKMLEKIRQRALYSNPLAANKM